VLKQIKDHIQRHIFTEHHHLIRIIPEIIEFIREIWIELLFDVVKEKDPSFSAFSG